MERTAKGTGKGLTNPLVSIVIPVENDTFYLQENLRGLQLQTYRHFEVFVSSSKAFSVSFKFARVVADPRLAGNVSAKRNKILTHGKGSIYVFHDDDVFTDRHYLENIVNVFKNQKVLAASGPLLTPSSDGFMQQASGLVLESYMGSFGAGTFRNRMTSARTVYDYPAANLVMRSAVFKKLGGFESGLYPGEDTRLCLELFNEYKTGVNYNPKLYVYHHRKPLFRKHLAQIGRYGHQRGWFALSYPETSFKIQYLLPSLFVAYCVVSVITSLFLVQKGNILGVLLLLAPFLLYGILVVTETLLLTVARNPLLFGVVVLGIMATHIYYGYCFLRSFLNKIFSKLWLFISLIKKI